MAVGFGALNIGATGTSVASFTWNHNSSGARSAVVFVVSYASTSDVATSVTFGGTTMTAVGTGVASSAETGTIVAYFLDNITQGATTAVVVNRTNNATVMYATSFSFTALGACETFGVSQQSNGAIAASGLTNIDDGSPGTNSLRCAGAYTGASTPLSAGVGCNGGGTNDQSLLGASSAYEAVAGQGSRGVGFQTGVTDDLAVVALAVREIPPVLAIPDVVMAPVHLPFRRS